MKIGVSFYFKYLRIPKYSEGVMIVWLRRASRRNIQNGISILNPLESPLFPGKTRSSGASISPKKASDGLFWRAGNQRREPSFSGTRHSSPSERERSQALLRFKGISVDVQTQHDCIGFLFSWQQEMRRELLKHSDWNVIVVDWAGGSLPLYTQATANTRLVGLEIAYFINYLKVMQLVRSLLTQTFISNLYNVKAIRDLSSGFVMFLLVGNVTRSIYAN